VRVALVLLTAAAAVVLWRRRRSATPSVVVEWRDGTEITLSDGRPEHERLVAVAERALA
jgi:hypothetical protein